MNSIHQNQPEHNRSDLQGATAIAKIRELAEGHTCFFCTTLTPAAATGARPMSVLQVDEQGSLWFMSSKDSVKNQELQNDSEVKLYFQGSQHSDFLELHGYATVSTDKAKIKELWKPIIKTWFTEGIDDPRITVIQVTPTDGYYWDTKHNQAIAGMKMLIGAAIGKTLDDSVEGTLRH
ncbi:MAG: pyridoxamine 5'-phosphate oxidase family protein [Pseudomonadota bacterium]